MQDISGVNVVECGGWINWVTEKEGGMFESGRRVVLLSLSGSEVSGFEMPTGH